MKKILRAAFVALFIAATLAASLVGCAAKKKVIIYTSMEDYRIEYMQKKLDEKFPDYDVVLEYKSSGEHATTLKAAGKNSECDITYNLEYIYAQELADLGVLANLDGISDFSVFVDDMVESTYYLPQEKLSCAIAVNTESLRERKLPAPASYEDLLDPMYKGLISMPNPASSGTGYAFLLNLVNEWGEEAAYEYFDKLSENILSFTSSGSAPVNSLVSGEVVIAFGMTSQTVLKINEGAPLEFLEFEEGAPYAKYAQGVIAGKETDKAVMEVFEYLSTELTMANHQLYFPDTLYKDVKAHVDNYPDDIKYGNMSNYDYKTKGELLDKWKH